MYVCMYVCKYVHMYVCKYVHMYVCMYVVYVCTYLGFLLSSAVMRLFASSDSFPHTAGFTFKSAWKKICLFLQMCKYMYVCMDVCMYVYIYYYLQIYVKKIVYTVCEHKCLHA